MTLHQNRDFLFTSESVTEGHPDKVCDQISDAVLDAILAKEARLQAEGYVSPTGEAADLTRARCASEGLATTGLVLVSGEIRTSAYVDVESIAREVLDSIGYNRAKYGFDGGTCAVLNAIHGQSSDIAQGVDGRYDDQWGAPDEGCGALDRIGGGDRGRRFG